MKPGFRTVVCIGLMLCAMTGPQLLAQTSSYRTKNYFELSASASGGQFASALSWSHMSTLTKRIPNLKIGYGIRFTSFVAGNKFYVTAPSKYTSPVQSPATIFSETIEGNIDTITTATANTN